MGKEWAEIKFWCRPAGWSVISTGLRSFLTNSAKVDRRGNEAREMRIQAFHGYDSCF